MQDAFGGILNLVLIVLFLVIVEGILGLTVCYTKAFRMKNYVISTIEEYEGYGCFDNSGETACRKKITEKAQKMGYAPVSINCDGYEYSVNPTTSNSGRLFCANEQYDDNTKSYSYRIVTQVDINIPIVQNIMGFSFFQVKGDTRTIERGKFKE